jgi:Major tropism determinant N-terminal domain
MTTRIKIRRDTSANWEIANPTLALGEPGYDLTENKIKIGDGSTAWLELPFLTDVSGNTFTLTPATTNDLGGVKLGNGFVLDDDDKVRTTKLVATNHNYRLELTEGGTLRLPDGSEVIGSTLKGIHGTGELNYTGMTIGPDAEHSEESWMYVDHTGAHIATQYNTDQKLWTFGNDGNITLPSGGDIKRNGESVLGGSGANLGNFTFTDSTMHIPVLGGGSTSYLNAGGVGHRNSVQLRTAVSYVNTDINTSEIALEAGNGGISAQVYGHWTGGADGSGGPTLVYAGVENVSGANGPGFAGMVAIDPGVTSQYAVSVNEDGKIFLSVGAPVTTTQYTAALGVLTTNIDPESGFAQLNGILVNPDDTVINGRSKITMSTDRGTVLFGNQPEFPTGPSHFHIMKLNAAATDLFFGDDFNYVKLPGNYEGIVNDYGVEIGTSGSNTWRFGTDGNLTLPQLSTIADAEAGIELTINRRSAEWYSIYGSIRSNGNTNTNTATTTGSVIQDTNGNVYVLGSIVNTNGFDSDNLFLKYNSDGVIQWSKTWTDSNHLPCGSYNASTRLLAPTLGIADQETLYWIAYQPYIGQYSYVGTMDTEGNMVDGYGTPRASVQLNNIRLADLEVSTGTNVFVVGARMDGYNNGTPLIAKIDLNTHRAVSAFTISPPYFLRNSNNISSTNFFKSVAATNSHVVAVGNYLNDDEGYDWPILIKHVEGGATNTYHLTSNVPRQEIWSEVVVYSDYHEAEYVLLNNVENETFGVVGKLASNYSGYTWQTAFGQSTPVYLYGMTFDTDGCIYVVGDMPGPPLSGTDFFLAKIDGTGEVLWQRQIGSAEYDGNGEEAAGPPGWGSSTGISVHGDHVVITGVTTDKDQVDAVTIKYPTSGDLLGDFGDFHVNDIDVGYAGWNYTISDLTGGTVITDISGDNNFISDIGQSSLIATTKTLEAGFDALHWDMTNNHLYIPERKWTFGTDGSIMMPNDAKLYEDEPNTLIVTSKGGTTLTYKPYEQVSDVPKRTIIVDGVQAGSAGVEIFVDKKINNNEEQQYSSWLFKDSGGLQFPDGSIQHGAYQSDELMLDGGSAVSVFPTATTPRAADGGGSSSRYGSTAPTYNGGTGGANLDPTDFILLLNGGGA